MLGKLIKYDIRSTWRDFAGIYLAILLCAIFLPIIFTFANNDIIYGVWGVLMGAISIAAVVITVIMLFKIFNTNVFQKQGYLTMTLPVSGSEIVASKLIVGTMWIVLTGIVTLVGFFILLLNLAPPADVLSQINKGFSLLSVSEYFAIVLILIVIIASILKEIAKLFLACSVAHWKRLGRFRIILGIISYFVLSWLEIQVLRIISFIAGQIPWFEEFGREMTTQYGSLSCPEDLFQLTGMFNVSMGLLILYALALTVVFSTGTIWLLNHKLELD